MSGLIGHRGLLLRRAGSVAEAASILAALRAWWALDENAASATFADSHGSHDLSIRTGGSATNSQDVSTATGMQGRAFNCNGVDDRAAYIPRSDTGLDMADADFSFGGWFKLRTEAATATFVMGRVGDASVTAIQAYIYLESDGTLRAAASTDGSVSGRVVANSGLSAGGWSASEFQLVVFTFNRTADQVELRYRRSGYASGALQKVTAAFPSALYTTANDSNFTINEGLRNDASFFSSNRAGVFVADECFFVDKALTDDEVDYLYNAGAGRSYAQLLADGS